MYSDDEWDIFDLRNIVKSWVNDVSAVFGFVIGHAYEVEIRQVLCESLNIDYVFGIDIPCIKERSKDIDIDKKISDLIKKSGGECGLYIRRCLNDLNMALKHPDDTAFYCFRGLEALKQCCRYVFEINEEKKQWERLSEITGFGRDDIEFIRTGAFPARHGDISLIDAEGRVKMLERTWDIVEAFIEKA